MFHLTRVVDDQLKWLSWFVTGALVEHNVQSRMDLGPEQFQAYYQDTLNKIVRYLTGQTASDASFSDFQCVLATEARKLFNPTPVGFVTAGDIEHTREGQLPPNFANGIENEKQARYWMDECKLRVLPVYVGKPINKID